MTDKELRKLSRGELLELLLAQTREVDRLNAQVEDLQQQLENRRIKLSQTGSIAEAALQLNHVFEAAQAAADQYLASVMSPVTDTEKHCLQMLEDTQKQCDQLLQDTRTHAAQVWEVIRREMYNPKLTYTQWQEISDYIYKQLSPKQGRSDPL